MNVSTLATSEATFVTGAISRIAVLHILRGYGNTITWSEFATWRKSEFTLVLDCEAAWSARDDIADFIEAGEASR